VFSEDVGRPGQVFSPGTSPIPVRGHFAPIAAFSLTPQLLAWSTLATSSDIVCYMYVAWALLLAGAMQGLPSLAQLPGVSQ